MSEVGLAKKNVNHAFSRSLAFTNHHPYCTHKFTEGNSGIKYFINKCDLSQKLSCFDVML